MVSASSYSFGQLVINILPLIVYYNLKKNINYVGSCDPNLSQAHTWLHHCCSFPPLSSIYLPSLFPPVSRGLGVLPRVFFYFTLTWIRFRAFSSHIKRVLFQYVYTFYVNIIIWYILYSKYHNSVKNNSYVTDNLGVGQSHLRPTLLKYRVGHLAHSPPLPCLPSPTLPSPHSPSP